VEEIRARFDNDVERFSNLETGQSATIDAPLVLDLIAQCAAAATPHARSLLDIGCGAGNYSLRLAREFPRLAVTLGDLSRPMLDRAVLRLAAAGIPESRAVQGDIRELDFEPGSFDLIAAAAVFHHLRDDAQWERVFADLYRWLRPGGSVWISDLVCHDDPAVHAAMWRRYGEYLAAFKGDDYRRHVFAYIEKEDTPRPVLFQTDLLRRVGFRQIDLLHKNGCFAAFGGVK
jgi:tRNA (cmo5U34)-methyltransferase